jgi:hypothetical protein
MYRCIVQNAQLHAVYQLVRIDGPTLRLCKRPEQDGIAILELESDVPINDDALG